MEAKHKVKISDLQVVPAKTRKVTDRTGESLSNVDDKNGKLVEPTSHYDPWQYEEGDCASPTAPRSVELALLRST